MEFSDKYFDTAPDRRGSGSYKWDSEAGAGDVVPLWVADMDFKTAPVVIEALRRRVEHGVFGYTLVDDEYYAALHGWFAERHGYTIDTRQVIYTSGVVPALSAIIKALRNRERGSSSRPLSTIASSPRYATTVAASWKAP